VPSSTPFEFNLGRVMSGIVVVSGNPRAGSRTGGLAVAVGEAIAAASGQAPTGPGAPVVIEVGALGPGLLTPGDAPTEAAVATIKDADVLVIATPTYKGSYTGILKVLLDYLPSNALAGKRAVPVVTAGIAPQAAAAEALLRQLLTELGADVVTPGVGVVEADLPQSATIADKFAAGHDW
jgi:FMN reductase